MVVKKVSAQLSREGCFDLLTLEDVENKTGATLLLDANYTSTGAPTRSGCACRASVSWRRCLPPG
ncbi:lipoprotein ynfC [Klebsiella pneumoniae]|nr:lipoprotein ynfC [Klebsiella pneumoniae]